jgi:integrase
MTVVEISRLLEAAPDRQARALLITLARTGMRPGEAIALKWTDVNFTGRTILIERASYAGIVSTTKTGKSRHVHASQQLCAALAELYVEREKEKLAGKWEAIPAWVFCLPNGDPFRWEHVRSIFARSLKRAGLSGHTAYDLRHTFASALLANQLRPAPLTYVAQQMGHSRPTTTLTHYAHWLSGTNDKSYVDALDQPKLAPLSGTSFQKVPYFQGNLAESQLTCR